MKIKGNTVGTTVSSTWLTKELFPVYDLAEFGLGAVVVCSR